jgi:release factor glutamine methyltransferase
MSTLQQALRAATASLRGCSDAPRLDAELLLAHVTGRSRGSLLVHAEEPLADALAQRYAALVAERGRDVPLAYLLGEWEFWSLPLRVTPAVLVPRPETETLVAWALELLAEDFAGAVVDLGTGSGAIALALASERPQASVLATDASAEALAIACANAAQLGLPNVAFAQGDWWRAVAPAMRYALAVSNPPYVAAGDLHLERLRAEPLAALAAGPEGLDAARAIVADAGAHLLPGAWLLLEHGYEQGAAVRQLLHDAGFMAASTRRDLAGHERVSGGRWPGGAP